jgi:HSP20 family protein
MAMRDLISRNRSSTPALRTGELQPFFALHREMNRLFDDLWRDVGGVGIGRPDYGFGSAASWPNVDVAETDKEIKVQAELPGLEEKDVELLLNDGVLTIRGEKKSEIEDKERQLSERFYGRFERQIPLDAEVQQDKVVASFAKGVLTVTLPKAPTAQTQAKRIPINK